MNSIFPGIDLVAGIVPVNLATAANTGNRLKPDRGTKVAIVFFKGAAAQGTEDPTVTVLQHDAASSGNSKALNFTEFKYKVATTLTTATAWTAVTRQSATNTATVDAWDEKEAILVIEIDAEDLDRENGYYWLSANVADTGTNAQLGAVLYIVGGLRHAQ